MANLFRRDTPLSFYYHLPVTTQTTIQNNNTIQNKQPAFSSHNI